MKKLSTVGFALLAISSLSFAQEKTVDPQTITQLDELTQRFMDTMNSNDANKITEVYAKDAVIVTDTQGPIYGLEAIQKFFAEAFQLVHFSNHQAKMDPKSPQLLSADKVWRNGDFSETLQVKGKEPVQVTDHWSAIEVKEGDTWKHWRLTYNFTPAPAK